jgi:hypothetical protein
LDPEADLGKNVRFYLKNDKAKQSASLTNRWPEFKPQYHQRRRRRRKGRRRKKEKERIVEHANPTVTSDLSLKKSLPDTHRKQHLTPRIFLSHCSVSLSDICRGLVSCLVSFFSQQEASIMCLRTWSDLLSPASALQLSCKPSPWFFICLFICTLVLEKGSPYVAQVDLELNCVAHIGLKLTIIVSLITGMDQDA